MPNGPNAEWLWYGFQSRDAGRFPNPEILGLSRCQSRDFGTIKFYLLNLFYTSFQSILRIYSFIESTSRVISSRCICVTASLIYLLLLLRTVHGRGRQTYRRRELVYHRAGPNGLPKNWTSKRTDVV